MNSFDALHRALVDARRTFDQSVPLWPDHELPTRRHRRRDCSLMSAAGKTQIAPHLLSTSLWGLEFCPCGAFRVLFDGTPHSRWECRNKALADPTWFTRRDRAATEGMPS